jgi:hypothetical protein
MPVVASDGQHVGTVDRVDGTETLKLTKSDPVAKGMHHYLPLEWVSEVDDHLHLSKSSKEVFDGWALG